MYCRLQGFSSPSLAQIKWKVAQYKFSFLSHFTLASSFRLVFKRFREVLLSTLSQVVQYPLPRIFLDSKKDSDQLQLSLVPAWLNSGRILSRKIHTKCATIDVDFCLVPGISISSLKLEFFWQLGAIIPSTLLEKKLVLSHNYSPSWLRI
jgi:hypothetical protein